MIYTYIKRSVPARYVHLTQKLNSSDFNNLGSSYQDYLEDKWVLLSKQQVKFREENPSASVKEVFEMKLYEAPEYVPSIEELKARKIAEIDAHDISEAVNSFSIDGFNAWFSVQERLNYKQSVEAAKLLGVQELNFFIGDVELSVSTEKAEKFLAALQLYADQCFIVTKRHKLAVEALDSTELIEAYDFTVGYPEKPVFNL